jgi:hypothetical protein
MLSHCRLFDGIGKILGVGFIVITTVFVGPDEQPVGLIGTIVYVTV